MRIDVMGLGVNMYPTPAKCELIAALDMRPSLAMP